MKNRLWMAGVLVISACAAKAPDTIPEYENTRGWQVVQAILKEDFKARQAGGGSLIVWSSQSLSLPYNAETPLLLLQEKDIGQAHPTKIAALVFMSYYTINNIPHPPADSCIASPSCLKSVAVSEDTVGVLSETNRLLEQYQQAKKAMRFTGISDAELLNERDRIVGVLKTQLTKVNQEKAQRQEEANKKRESNSIIIHQRKMAEINKRYGLLALALIHQQQITYATGNRLIMNGRPLSMNEKEFGNVLYSTFELCEGYDAYVDIQGIDDACRNGVIKDLKAWITLSKDKTITNRAWAIGHSEASTSNLAGFGAVSFHHWVGIARVTSSKGY
ncbi:hypothetical protein [Serratia liquefaciens]|uniref:hypothetical protein n=1 Tax=Serratia liquefaciens TaxID=614 RepID=UPI00370A3C5C